MLTAIGGNYPICNTRNVDVYIDTLRGSLKEDLRLKIENLEENNRNDIVPLLCIRVFMNQAFEYH